MDLKEWLLQMKAMDNDSSAEAGVPDTTPVGYVDRHEIAG